MSGACVPNLITSICLQAISRRGFCFCCSLKHVYSLTCITFYSWQLVETIRLDGTYHGMVMSYIGLILCKEVFCSARTLLYCYYYAVRYEHILIFGINNVPWRWHLQTSYSYFYKVLFEESSITCIIYTPVYMCYNSTSWSEAGQPIDAKAQSFYFL